MHGWKLTQAEYQAVRSKRFSRFFCRLVFNRWKCCCDRTDNLFIFPTSCCFAQDNAGQQSRRGGWKNLRGWKQSTICHTWWPFLDLEKQKKVSVLFCFVFFLAFYPAWLPRCLWPAGSSFWKERSVQHAAFSYSKLRQRLDLLTNAPFMRLSYSSRWNTDAEQTQSLLTLREHSRGSMRCPGAVLMISSIYAYYLQPEYAAAVCAPWLLGERCSPGVLISYMLSVSHANKWELFFSFAKWSLSKVGVQVDGLMGERGWHSERAFKQQDALTVTQRDFQLSGLWELLKLSEGEEKGLTKANHEG